MLSWKEPSFTANRKHTVIMGGFSISIFNINTGALTPSMKTHYLTQDVQMSVNGTCLLVCHDLWMEIEILDMQSGVMIAGRKNYANPVFLSPDEN